MATYGVKLEGRDLQGDSVFSDAAFDMKLDLILEEIGIVRDIVDG